MRIIATCSCGCDIDTDDDYIEIRFYDDTLYLCSWKCSERFIRHNMAYKEVVYD